MATLTTANSTITISVDPIFPSPVSITGYGVDSAFATDSIEKTIMRIGIDGQVGSAYVFRVIPITITLLATSPSLPIFNRWATTLDTVRDSILCNATITYPSIGYRFSCIEGALTGWTPFPEATEYANDIPYEITFARIVPERIA